MFLGFTWQSWKTQQSQGHQRLREARQELQELLTQVETQTSSALQFLQSWPAWHTRQEEWMVALEDRAKILGDRLDHYYDMIQTLRQELRAVERGS